MKVALVFAAQYLYILMLGAQHINVIWGRYLGAMFVSLMLGILGFSLVAAIAAAKGATWRDPVWWAYVLAGPLGIVSAMALYGET